MNKMTRIAFAAFAITVLYACNDLKENVEPVSGVETHLVFTATNERFCLDTKTVKMDDASTWWNASEEISVFYGSGSDGGSKFTSQNTTLQEIVEFDGSIQMSGTGKEFWAVYPYSLENECDGTSISTTIPSSQTASEGNFSGDAFPTVAKSKTLDLAFWNICGGLKFFVSRSDIKSVTFRGNNGEALAGKVKVAFNASGLPEVTEVKDGKREIVLTAPDGGTFKAGKYYYITLLPTALDGGFTMTFNTNVEKGSVVSNNPQTIKRSVFGILKNIDSKVAEWKSTWAEPEWVDLGLPSGLKWASWNVGASAPEGYGDYFAWGETEPKTQYDWSTYKWCSGSYTSLTKYNTNPSYGSVDNKTVLDPEDDVCQFFYGENWRMPTTDEWAELIRNCTNTWMDNYNDTGVSGRLYTSKVSGYTDKSIFLPAAGYRRGSRLYDTNSYSGYWCPSIKADKPYTARIFYYDFSKDDDGRYTGYPVRPVYDDRIHPESVSFNKSILSLYVGDLEQLTATVLPDNATVKSVVWTSDNTEVATVDDQGIVTALKAGTATITATTVDGAKPAFCEVTVTEPPLINNHEYVDLGLPSGLKWATTNVGATKPEEYGDYFAWGETVPKSDYSWSTYKWCNGSKTTLTKYCTAGSYWDSTEPKDNKIVLDPEDDAAYMNWGDSWRMPTDDEWEELLSNCTWTWTLQNNVNGRLVTGPNGKSIFLPAAGDRGDTYLNSADFSGTFWSSSLGMNSPDLACGVYIDSGDVLRGDGDRCFGVSVRPVSE